MVIRNSSHFRVFNANGVNFRKSFISQIFRKFGKFEDFFKLIKLLDLRNSRRFKLKVLITELCSFILSKKNNLFFDRINSRKYFIIFFQYYIQYIFYNIEKDRNFYYNLFGKYISQKDCNKNFYFSAFFGKKKKRFLNNVYISYNYRKERLPFSKNYCSSINFKILNKNIYKTLNEKIDRSIYVNAEGFTLFTGSITPFGKTKQSWFGSTGLKADVECNEINFWDKQINQEKFENFSEGDDNHVIFKMINFKNKIKFRFKATIRHIFNYKINHFIGIQRFQSENRVNFDLFHEFYRISENFSFFYSKRFIFSSNSFNPKVNLNTFFFKKKNVFKFTFGLKLFELKMQYISFYILKNLLKTYLYLKKKQFNIFQYSSFYLKGIVYTQRIYNILIRMCNTFLNKILVLKENTLLLKRKNYIKNFSKNQNYFMKNIFLNKIFSKKIIKNLLDYSFNNYFLDIFLIRQEFYPYIIKLRESADLKPEVVYKLQEKISPKPYWFKSYNLIYLYFYFLIDCKLNFRLFMMKNSIENFQQKKIFAILIKPFKLFKRAWKFNKFINFTDSKKYFSLFLKKISFSFKQYFYYYFLIKNNNKINLNLKYFMCNLIIFIHNLINKNKDNDFYYFNEMIKLSNFFLGKWFYYRQINKIIDNESCSFYDTNKPGILLNFNTRESSAYIFRKINALGNKTFNKLDNYLKKNSEINFKSIFNEKKNKNFFKKKKIELKLLNKYEFVEKTKKTTYSPKTKYKKKKNFYEKKRIFRFKIAKGVLLSNIWKYRTSRWSNKFSFQKDPLEIGYLYKLPLVRRLRRGRMKFFKDRKLLGSFTSRRTRWRFFLRKFKKYYKNEILTYYDLDHEISHSFLCLLNTKKSYYSEQNFWFKKKLIQC